MTSFNEDGTRAADPLTKVGVMLAIRDMARKHGATEPLAALEWALARRILVSRPGIVFERGHDDLMLTPGGQELVARFWHDRDRRRRAQGRKPTLS